MPNPEMYRYVHYFSTRVLNAEELTTQQQIQRLVNSANRPMAYGLNAQFKTGAFFNVSVGITGLTATLSPVDATRPMLVFIRGIWEPFTTVPFYLGGGTSIYLNYVVISQAQPSGDAEMAELQLSFSTADTSGIPNPNNSELERNSLPVVVCSFTNANGVLTYLPSLNVYTSALANLTSAGMVKLTTPTSAGMALSSDDITTTNQRVPTPLSIDSTKIIALLPSGSNADGSVTMNPSTPGQGGILASKLIYVAGNQTVEAALISASAAAANTASALTTHIGHALGSGVHPMPSYADVGAAPISHVNSSFDNGQHQPTFTSDHSGFIVTRNPANAPAIADYAYLVRDTSGNPISGLLHNGDLRTTSAPYPFLSAGLAAAYNHVSQVSHANPHGLAIGDILSFKPVQNGTGIGQLLNDVKIGYDGSNVRITIDATDEGSICFQVQAQAYASTAQANAQANAQTYANQVSLSNAQAAITQSEAFATTAANNAQAAAIAAGLTIAQVDAAPLTQGNIAAGDNTTKVANTAFVGSAISVSNPTCVMADLSNSYAFATTYVNTSSYSKTIAVTGFFTANVAHNSQMLAYVGPNGGYQRQVAGNSTQNGQGYVSVTFRVPPGYAYYVTFVEVNSSGGTISLSTWIEWTN